VQVRYGTSSEAQWLTGTPFNEDAGAIVLSGRAAVQVADLVRGTTPYIAGRGNKAITLPVPISLEFADWREALRYAHEHFFLLPLDGELHFREQWGTEVVEIDYPNAALQSTQSRRIGQSTVETVYTFIVAGPPTFTLTGDAPLRIYSESGEALTTED
jgi:hypothetical protein